MHVVRPHKAASVCLNVFLLGAENKRANGQCAQL